VSGGAGGREIIVLQKQRIIPQISNARFSCFFTLALDLPGQCFAIAMSYFNSATPKMLNSPIITAASLHDRLANVGSGDLTIVDCRFMLGDVDLGRKQYETAHLPGAYYLDLNRDLSSPPQVHGGRHPLPADRVLGTKLAAMGINSDTLVVAYDDSRFAFAARLWWLLRYYGHERVAVLDGGYRNWVDSGYPVTANLPEVATPGNFQPQIDRVRAIQNSPAHILIDSREPDRYLGNTEPIDPVAGHIPSAVNYPWQGVSTPEGFVLPVDRQRQRWMAISPDLAPLAQPLLERIVYCGSGVTACVNLLSLELAGIEGGKLYPGSWSDWCSY
jgi:thiosulfate/3-mercaptopyruvate sulfurtransferase